MGLVVAADPALHSSFGFLILVVLRGDLVRVAVRPHPDPFPQDRGETIDGFLKTREAAGCREAMQQSVASNYDSLSPGERARVRANVN